MRHSLPAEHVSAQVQRKRTASQHLYPTDAGAPPHSDPHARGKLLL